MNIIRSIVNELNLNEKKYQHDETRRKIEDVELMMIDKRKDNVARYTSALSYLKFFEKYFSNLNKEQQEFAIGEMKRLREEIRVLMRDPDVMEYIKLQQELARLNTEKDEYYKAINGEFRRELIDSAGQLLPEIFVDQGDFATHIIVPGTIQTFDSPDQIEILVAPRSIHKFDDKSIDSIRKAKKFYNRTSFRYLQQLSEDYDFSLEGKDLGKVKIYRR